MHKRLAIPEIILIDSKTFKDSRGYFTVTYNKREMDEIVGHEINFVQDNLSKSTRHVLRGLHYQTQSAQDKLVRVVEGEIFDVAIDVARQLKSPKLLGTTYYRLGSTHSTLNQLPLAIDAYEKSRANFEQAGSPRDLIYILADLGTDSTSAPYAPADVTARIAAPTIAPLVPRRPRTSIASPQSASRSI